MESTFRMIDVGSKPVTFRRAIACGEISLSSGVIQAIQERRVPKGDVLGLAEVAGICAAKRTSDFLPLCHPLTLDAVRVCCEIDAQAGLVRVSSEVSTHGRTGVEMEALAATSAALLCVYDLTKSLDKGAIISGIRLESKEGGKSGPWRHPLSKKIETLQPTAALQGVRVGVLTVSDRASKGQYPTDESGDTIVSYLVERGALLVERGVVADEIPLIREYLQRSTEQGELELCIVTGGTGVGPRDLTPEALEPLWTKRMPGFGEVFRSRGLLNTPRAWLSRADAGLVGMTLVVLLPGSPGGVKDGLGVLSDILPHLLSMIRGGGH